MAKAFKLAVVILALALPVCAQVKSSGHVGGSGHGKFVKGGPVVNLSAKSLAFGSVTVGQTSMAQVVTLTNTGSSSLAITSIITTGNFANTTTCTGTLTNGSNCTISVTFSPLSTAALIGATTITDSAAGSPHVISLNGLGGAASAPIASLSVSSLSFGIQQENTTSAPQTFTLTNTGNASLTITSIVTTGNFANTTTCGSSLAASATCSIAVTFTPLSSVPLTGAVTFTDSAADSPQVVNLSGTGGGASAPSVNLSASSIAFANQVVGTTSAATVVTLTNVGTASLTIASIVTTGNFANSTTCGGTVAAGSNCTISVTFSPLSAAMLTGATTITDNATGSPHIVSLSGTGTGTAAIFFDNFASGDFSAWGGNSDPSIVINTNATYTNGQSYSAQYHYQVCSLDPINPAQPALSTQAQSGCAGHPCASVRTYYVKSAYENAVGGFSNPSVEESISVPANSVMTIAYLPTQTGAEYQTNYVSTSSGAETLQGSGSVMPQRGTSPTIWVEPVTGITTGGATPPATSTLCRSTHQDDDHSLNFNPALGFPSHFWIKWQVYVDTPINGGAAGIGRKLLYQVGGSSPGITWDFINAGWCNVDNNPACSGPTPYNFTAGTQNALLGSPTYYCNVIGNCNGAAAFGQWFTIKVEEQMNTASSTPYNGVIRVWVNGTLVIQQTAVPLNGTYMNAPTQIRFGDQCDRDASTYSPFAPNVCDEYRYITFAGVYSIDPDGP